MFRTSVNDVAVESLKLYIRDATPLPERFTDGASLPTQVLEGLRRRPAGKLPARISGAVRGAAKRVLPEIAIDLLTAARLYRTVHGRTPNLLFPKMFTEKVVRRSLFDRRPLLKRFADKHAVRGYVESKLGPDVLPKLYWLTQTPTDIPFDTLPDRFAVKPTHGSGWVHLVPDKAALDTKELIGECEYWLSQDFYKKHRERVYKDMPRRIIVEELIDDGSKGSPADYKMFVFHGRVELIQVIRGRFTEIGVYHFDRDWNVLAMNFNYEPFPGSVLPPPHWKDMIAAAETLGKDVDFVRADFYDTPEKFYFGELTTTPSAGLDRFNPASFDEYFGALW
jgi:hypothetical protein